MLIGKGEPIGDFLDGKPCVFQQHAGRRYLLGEQVVVGGAAIFPAEYSGQLGRREICLAGKIGNAEAVV